MPESTTAPPTTQTQDEASAQLNAELAAIKGDWTKSVRPRIDPEQIELLTQTVAKDCTLAELNLLLELGGRYGLSPFLGQIFAAKFDGDEGGVTIFTGRDGMLQAARNTGKLVRVVSAVVREEDAFELTTSVGNSTSWEERKPGDPVQVDPVTQLVHIRQGMGSKRGPIIGAYALIWRVGDPFPHYAEASWEEYGATRQEDVNGKATSWHLNHRDGFPEAMMRKVPESIGLKIAFGISGIQSAEELGDRPQRVQNLTNPGGATGAAKSAPIVVEYGDDDLGREVFALVKAVNELRPRAWTPVKVAMRINGYPSERAKLRDVLRRTLGSLGDRGKTALESIPHTKLEEPTQPLAAAVPAAPEGAGETQLTVDEVIADAVVIEPEPEPEAKPYRRNQHLNLVKRIRRLRARIVKLHSEAPTLESEEQRATAEATLAGMLEELEAFNIAAEAAGKSRKDA